ncbi:uncharacterized protein BDZ83DRAFT_158845 [Colletotrichum acutatum]|uniref:Uncharacterized protein n=1 Tax=Glomerella acutata TaxID=27357 RepID=A0AAD8XPZ8_GLOAC|nr:uncharacterized protein BDZ83DRAFT_158845 [Colletotrichum acutatum]KAK1731415.1 hypothetical protein BDZ83DRAFT_158845 [Colletotrichum acutatum]
MYRCSTSTNSSLRQSFEWPRQLRGCCMSTGVASTSVRNRETSKIYLHHQLRLKAMFGCHNTNLNCPIHHNLGSLPEDECYQERDSESRRARRPSWAPFSQTSTASVHVYNVRRYHRALDHQEINMASPHISWKLATPLTGPTAGDVCRIPGNDLGTGIQSSRGNGPLGLGIQPCLQLPRGRRPCQLKFDLFLVHPCRRNVET